MFEVDDDDVVDVDDDDVEVVDEVEPEAEVEPEDDELEPDVDVEPDVPDEEVGFAPALFGEVEGDPPQPTMAAAVRTTK